MPVGVGHAALYTAALPARTMHRRTSAALSIPNGSRSTPDRGAVRRPTHPMQKREETPSLETREKIGRLISLAFGLGFIAMGVYGYFHMGRFLDTAREATAVVIEIAHESATPKGRVHPVLQYESADGRKIVKRSDQHHNVKPADTLQVIYDPRNPTDMEITTLSRAKNRRVMFTAISIAVGLFVCALALGIDLKTWRRRRSL